MYKQVLAALAVVVGLSAWSGAHAVSDLRDPTRPPGPRLESPATTEPLADLSLESVLIGVDRRIAVINGEVLGEGDSLAGARVISIDADGVLMHRAGQRRRLKLTAAPDIRQP